MKIGVLGKPRSGDDLKKAYELERLGYSKIEVFGRAPYLNAVKPWWPCIKEYIING